MANKTSLQSLQVNVPSQCCCCCFNTTPEYRQCTAKTLSICCQNIVNELWKRGQHSIKTSWTYHQGIPADSQIVSVPSNIANLPLQHCISTPETLLRCSQNIVNVAPKQRHCTANTSSTSWEQKYLQCTQNIVNTPRNYRLTSSTYLYSVAATSSNRKNQGCCWFTSQSAYH